MPSYPMSEVKKHNKDTDLWMVIKGKVYDLTEYLVEHPGGDIIMEAAGTDGTGQFEDIGHSDEARDILKKYCIGELA